MTDWQPIDTAPKDGTLVMLRRCYRDRAMFEGPGRFALLHEDAPCRHGLGPDPLGRLSADDYRREAADRTEFVAKPLWLRADRMHLFPEPTHWMPIDAAHGERARPNEQEG